ncbi:hypothetical protein [Rufibacter soli]
MEKTKVYISFLQYTHSLPLGETLNIGVFFYSPSDEIIRFLRPKNFARIKCAYHDFDDFALKYILRNLNKNLSNERIEGLSLNGFNEFVNYVLKSFKSPTILASSARSLTIPLPFEVAIEKLFNKYFEYYNITKPLPTKHDEQYLLNSFKGALERKSPNLVEKIHRGRILGSDRVSLGFEYEWKNEKNNLIKPISFDLVQRDRIEKKSLEYYSKFNMLSKQASDEDCRFHILVSKPRDRSFYHNYENALKVLDDSSELVSIIQEDDLEKYVSMLQRHIN